MEPTLKYHPLMFDVLTLTRNPGCGQCLVGSLTVLLQGNCKCEKYNKLREVLHC